MTEAYNKQLEALAKVLVTPERFGKPAVAAVVELYPDLPQTHMYYGTTGEQASA